MVWNKHEQFRQASLSWHKYKHMTYIITNLDLQNPSIDTFYVVQKRESTILRI